MCDEKWKTDLLPYLPKRAAHLLLAVSENTPLEELRIRAEKPMQLRFCGRERVLSCAGGAPPMTREECGELLMRLCQYSLYAWEDELNDGYVTLEGGYRVGICGATARLQDGARRVVSATGFAVRIARQMCGVSRTLIPQIVDDTGRAQSTLVISAPGCGKTTLLRDAARALSNGLYGARAHSVSVADARCELSGGSGGVAVLDLGARTDVLSAVPRARAMRLLLTSLSPDVIVTDELGTQEDAEAVYEAINGGVAVIASAHASSLMTLGKKRALAGMLREGAFEHIVLLSRRRGTGTIERVWNLDDVRGGEMDAVIQGDRRALDGGMLRGGGLLAIAQDAIAQPGAGRFGGDAGGRSVWGDEPRKDHPAMLDRGGRAEFDLG